jgi:hypothetical protein
MSHTLVMVLAFYTIAAGFLVANDAAKNPPPHRTKKGKNPTVPFDNYWDSNSWENQSAGNFWHSSSEITSETRKPVTPPPAQSRIWNRIPRKKVAK